jgi:hypothetical protein
MSGKYLNSITDSEDDFVPDISFVQLDRLYSRENDNANAVSRAFAKLRDDFIMYDMRGSPFERFIMNADRLRMEAFRTLGIHRISLERFYNGGMAILFGILIIVLALNGIGIEKLQIELPKSTNDIEIVEGVPAGHQNALLYVLKNPKSEAVDKFLKGQAIFLAGQDNAGYDGMMLLNTPDPTTKILLHWETEFSLPESQSSDFKLQIISQKYEQVMKRYKNSIL